MCKAWQLIFSCFSLCALVKRCFTPAYIMSTCGMVWQALLCGTVEPLENIMAQHKTLYGDVRTDVVIPLPEGQTPQPPYWMI